MLFILYSPLILTAPEYVECETLYPDEFLDLFGIPENSITSAAIYKLYPSVSSLPELQPRTHTIQHHLSWDPYPSLIPSELFWSPPLRC